MVNGIFGFGLGRKNQEKLQTIDADLEAVQSTQGTQEQRLAQLEHRLDQVALWASSPMIQLTRLRAERLSEVLPAPSAYATHDEQSVAVELAGGRTVRLDLTEMARNDPWPIPATFDREGYHGENHFQFWVSGLVDLVKVRDAVETYGTTDQVAVLDLGCASGRFLRHPAAQQENWQLTGCDIDAMNVAWVKSYLPEAITVFQNTIYPHLPLPDASVDVVTAFSVFTHIDKLEDAWLLEIRRILKPGGLLYVTAHTERVWGANR
jgi:hypothetical protein